MAHHSTSLALFTEEQLAWLHRVLAARDQGQRSVHPPLTTRGPETQSQQGGILPRQAASLSGPTGPPFTSEQMDWLQRLGYDLRAGHPSEDEGATSRVQLPDTGQSVRTYLAS